MNTNLEMSVLDAGGRCGLHPTWKSFTGELNYHLFEPDPIQCEHDDGTKTIY